MSVRSDTLTGLARPSPLVAVAGIIVSMAFIALSNGVIFAYVPIRLAAEGVAPWVAGATVASMCAGGILGCLASGSIVRRAGHARAFSVLAAMVIVSVLCVAGPVWEALWVFGRGIYGFAVTGLFVVALSWLNDASGNERRGQVLATFYTTYVLAVGTGGLTLVFVDLESGLGPLLSVLFAAVAVIPVSLTRLPAPPPPARIKVDFRAVARLSPVGLAGMFAAGGMTMLVQGFAPIYASHEGFDKNSVALLFFLMQLGLIAVQLPLGAISDRVDRRWVLVFASLLIADLALIATRLDGVGLVWLVVVFALWAGATESIYSVANAHANDRAEPGEYVALASTMLVAWSISGFVFPLLATALTPWLGTGAFMYLVLVMALAYAFYVLWRVTRRASVPRAAQEPYQHLSAQAPVTTEAAVIRSS